MRRVPGFAAPNPLKTGPGERLGKIDDHQRLASLVGMAVDASLAGESYCYLTTTGRVSGEPREIEIWLGLDGDTLYMLSSGVELDPLGKPRSGGVFPCREDRATGHLGTNREHGSALRSARPRRMIEAMEGTGHTWPVQTERGWRFGPYRFEERCFQQPCSVSVVLRDDGADTPVQCIVTGDQGCNSGTKAALIAPGSKLTIRVDVLQGDFGGINAFIGWRAATR